METIIIHEATTVERTFTDPTKIQAGSDTPEQGPWNATMRLAIIKQGDPPVESGGTGVWFETTLDAGTYTITLTPDAMPFNGRILVGES
jgi:hypothetical protein